MFGFSVKNILTRRFEIRDDHQRQPTSQFLSFLRHKPLNKKIRATFKQKSK